MLDEVGTLSISDPFQKSVRWLSTRLLLQIKMILRKRNRVFIKGESETLY